MAKKRMTVAQLIEKLEALDPKLPINVWTSNGEYGTPAPCLVSKDGKIERALIGAQEDE